MKKKSARPAIKTSPLLVASFALAALVAEPAKASVQEFVAKTDGPVLMSNGGIRDFGDQ